MYGHHYGDWFGNNFMHGWGGGIMMMIFWVVLIVVVVYFFTRNRSIGSNMSSPHNTNGALDILKERYARGEISDEEFESKKKALK